MSSEPQTESRPDPQTEAGKRLLDAAAWRAHESKPGEQWGIFRDELAAAILAIEAEATAEHEKVARMVDEAIEAQARSSHSDVSADLEALRVLSDAATPGPWEYRKGYLRNADGEFMYTDTHPDGWFLEAAVNFIRAALAASSARAEAAPEREGLDVERLGRAIEEVVTKRAAMYDSPEPINAADALLIVETYARLAPTSPSSEEKA